MVLAAMLERCIKMSSTIKVSLYYGANEEVRFGGGFFSSFWDRVWAE
jgi:hypothetical protein